uniref:Uncharacterized protein n=1 Tax=Anguilla anguilla TaxID=7936 RepID=A0A0E9RBJ3_ANGAN
MDALVGLKVPQSAEVFPTLGAGEGLLTSKVAWFALWYDLLPCLARPN